MEAVGGGIGIGACGCDAGLDEEDVHEMIATSIAIQSAFCMRYSVYYACTLQVIGAGGTDVVLVMD